MAMPCSTRCAPSVGERVAGAVLVDLLRPCGRWRRRPPRGRRSGRSSPRSASGRRRGGRGRSPRRPPRTPRAGRARRPRRRGCRSPAPASRCRRPSSGSRTWSPRRSRCSRRRRRPAASRSRPGSGSRGTCPGSTRRRRRSRSSTAPVPCTFAVSAAPQASGMPPPTMPFAPSMPLTTSATCIEPPLPLQMPVCRPISSAAIAADVDALGDAVAVAAVGAGDEVGVVEVRADADRDRLLAGVEVDEAGDLTVGELPHGRLLEAADQRHPLVHPEQRLAGQLDPAPFRHRHRDPPDCSPPGLDWKVILSRRRAACHEPATRPTPPRSRWAEAWQPGARADRDVSPARTCPDRASATSRVAHTRPAAGRRRGRHRP